MESDNLLEVRKNLCDQAGLVLVFMFDFQLRNSIKNCWKSEIDWNYKLRFEAFMVTPLSSLVDGGRFQQSNFDKEKKSLCKLYNSTLCWFSISLSLFLNFSKDGLKLGSSFQHCHYVIPKRTSKKVLFETVRPIPTEQP